MNIGILGSGEVAKTLPGGFLKHGHEVMMGTRDAATLADWIRQRPAVRTGSVEQAAHFGDVVVLAVKGSAAETVLHAAGARTLGGKVVIDATNPIADAPPANGVLKMFTNLDESLMERLQRACPHARLVKAFNSVGTMMMVNPDFAGTRPTMFICGNDVPAKQTVSQLLDQFGWEAEDMGQVESARALEPLCMLWCIPGFLRNQWSHAFKLLK
ncbi:MAG: hypothetical protein RL684_2983 [Pseudomonadota bacterium]|jgi:predicted dinucleotide-binding enzyme